MFSGQQAAEVSVKLDAVLATGGALHARALEIPNDPALPGCALLREEKPRIEALSQWLEQWLDPQAQLLQSTVIPWRYAPGKRCNFQIDLTILPAPGALTERRRVIGKVYAKDHGAEVYRMLQEFRSRGFAGNRFLVPQPLAFDPRWKFLLLSYAEGDLLRSLVLEGSGNYWQMEEAANWLLAFHQCGVTEGRRYTFRSHLETLGSMKASLAKVCPGSDKRLQTILRRLEEQGDALPGWSPGPTHRDFSPDHLVFSGGHVTGIDFDEFRQYDPLFDVAHFMGHLRLLGLLHGGNVTRFAEFGEIFQAAYRAGARNFSAGRVRFYHAVVYFKLAHIMAVVIRPPDWKEGAEEFLRGAEKVLDQHS